MSKNVELNIRSGPDSLLVEIAEYITKQEINSELALSTARNCLIDTIGCGLLALTFPACTKMLGPIVPGTSNLVTYHVERVCRALLEDMAEADAFSERSKQKLYIRGALSELKVDEIVSDENKGYLHGGYASVRLDAMKFLMGGGPLDFLWNTESTL